MDFFNQTGAMAIGSRLRLLTDTITRDAAAIYALYGVALQPKWFPVFHMLVQGEQTVTGIAQHIRHSHPSVCKIVREMAAEGIVRESNDPADGRRTVVSLTPKGRTLADKIQHQYRDVNDAIEDILQHTEHNLWKAIGEWEGVLEEKSLLHRVQEQKKRRESEEVAIVPFKEAYTRAFRDLNEQWITTYFRMEDADYKVLDHPKEYILDHGGAILVALYHNEPAGVCALIKMDDPAYDYELAKMAVKPEVQGKKIGFLLGRAIIAKAREMGASSLYLESNTILKPAIGLYRKLGFTEISGRPTPYERCNIQMGLKLSDDLPAPV